MSIWRQTAAAGVLLAGVAGCAAPAPPPGDPRVYVTPGAGVFADLPVEVPGELLRASLRLVNPSAADRPVLQTTDWISNSGMPVRSRQSAPQRLTVPRFGDATIQIIAPSPAAVQFRMRIEPDFSAP